MDDTLKQDADALEARVRAELPPSHTWTMPPRGYREGLTLCVIDGVSRQLVNDAADELVASFRQVVGDGADTAGVDALTDRLDNGAEAWLSNASLSPTESAAVASALRTATGVLTEAAIAHTGDLVAVLKGQGFTGSLGEAWNSHDGLTHRMLADTAMLSGYLDPEVDRIIVTYVAEAIGTDPATTPPARVIATLTEVAARFDSKILPLEFAMLEFVRN